jgi:hypothetical protein
VFTTFNTVSQTIGDLADGATQGVNSSLKWLEVALEGAAQAAVASPVRNHVPQPAAAVAPGWPEP